MDGDADVAPGLRDHLPLEDPVPDPDDRLGGHADVLLQGEDQQLRERRRGNGLPVRQLLEAGRVDPPGDCEGLRAHAASRAGAG